MIIVYGIVQVSETAEIPEKEPFYHKHEQLAFDEIEIKEEGSIYIFVSNDDGQNMDVYFDDFRVTHEYSDIVAGSDYYPFGLAMGGRQVTRDPYRYGYQGQFAEKDKETGWNSFEARMYDGRIGKWLSPDPAGQYFSPYLGMGNNPVSMFDPDGRFDSRFGAWLYKTLNGGGEVYKQDGEWRVLQTSIIKDNYGVAYSNEYYTDWGNKEINLKGNFDLSAGLQFGEHVTNFQGFDFGLASWTLAQVNVDLNYNFNKGFSYDWDIIPVWKDSKVKQFVSFDVPTTGFSLERSFMHSNPYGTLSDHLDIHGGAPFLGIHRVYDLRSPNVETKIGGGYGARAIIGIDANYELSIK